MASTLYRHTQRGTSILLIVLASAVVVAGWTAWMAASQSWDKGGLLFALLPGAVIFLGVAWYFGSMTVEVTDNELRWKFRAGGWYSIRRSEIDSASIARHSLWHGYGVRWIGPNRWTYIVSGRDTVEVRLKDGGWRRIGTDDPEGLLAALTYAGSRSP